MPPEPDGVADDEISTAEAAKVRGCDVSTVRRHIYKGKLPARRVGRDWLIRRTDLDEVA